MTPREIQHVHRSAHNVLKLRRLYGGDHHPLETPLSSGGLAIKQLKAGDPTVDEEYPAAPQNAASALRRQGSLLRLQLFLFVRKCGRFASEAHC